MRSFSGKSQPTRLSMPRDGIVFGIFPVTSLGHHPFWHAPANATCSNSNTTNAATTYTSGPKPENPTWDYPTNTEVHYNTHICTRTCARLYTLPMKTTCLHPVTVTDNHPNQTKPNKKKPPPPRTPPEGRAERVGAFFCVAYSRSRLTYVVLYIVLTGLTDSCVRSRPRCCVLFARAFPKRLFFSREGFPSRVPTEEGVSLLCKRFPKRRGKDRPEAREGWIGSLGPLLGQCSLRYRLKYKGLVVGHRLTQKNFLKISLSLYPFTGGPLPTGLAH